MSLQGQIDTRLWTAVQKSYEDGDYSGSILDSFYFLSDLIRNKSGCESDGHALVGAAFGGANPIIKINSFRTESELSEQRGMEQLLRGLYWAIRNPRSHEKRTDSVEAADAVITFISFLIGIIDKSRSPFDTEQIIRKIFDKHFVQTIQYADALVSKIPLGKRYDVACQIFQRRTEGKTENIVLFTRSLLATISEDAKTSYWEMVSASLEEATSDAEFRSAVQIANKDWTNLTQIARLRTENRLISSIKEGEYDSEAKNCIKGGLGTWANGLEDHFSMKEEFTNALIDRMSSDNQAAVNYVLTYFITALLDPKTPPSWRLSHVLKSRLFVDDKEVYGALWFVGKSTCHQKWKDELKQAIDEFEQRNPDEVITDDEFPF
jgi:uncharacterized protein (TIGR02391 family)